MPLGFHPYPGGIFDNSPPFQRWVRRFRNLQVPKGRLKPRDLSASAVPSGLAPVGRCFPNVETLGYYRMSLRDKDSDTFGKSLPRSNPSGLGAGALRSAVTGRLRFFIGILLLVLSGRLVLPISAAESATPVPAATESQDK